MRKTKSSSVVGTTDTTDHEPFIVKTMRDLGALPRGKTGTVPEDSPLGQILTKTFQKAFGDES